ncbi:hypothetical protein KM043_007390 [Ampulex compressa]|nr:hypothetical protein KM043_007390 [Ampulex compressa]
MPESRAEKVHLKAIRIGASNDELVPRSDGLRVIDSSAGNDVNVTSEYEDKNANQIYVLLSINIAEYSSNVVDRDNFPSSDSLMQ